MKKNNVTFTIENLMFKDANITMIKKTGKDGKDEIDV